MINDQVKLCNRCQYFKPDNVCTYDVRNYVTGEVGTSDCVQNRNNPHYCGHTAEWFKPRESTYSIGDVFEAKIRGDYFFLAQLGEPNKCCLIHAESGKYAGVVIEVSNPSRVTKSELVQMIDIEELGELCFRPAKKNKTCG